MRLIIKLHFPLAQFHGREFPPSPTRLFQALIAASHRGIYELQNVEVRNNALEWLENIAPPIIETCAFEASGTGSTNYVPNNDNSFAHNKTAKSLQKFVFSNKNAIRYVWKLYDGEENRRHAEVICKMTRLVTHLGHGQDAVFAGGEIVERDDEAAEKVEKRTVFHPRERDGGRWTVPTTGALESYKRRYQEFLRTGNSHTINAAVRQVEYISENTIDLTCPYAMFEMWELDDKKKFSRDARDLRELAVMIRIAVARFFKSAAGVKFKNHYGEDLISRKIFGHELTGEDATNKAVNAAHLAFVSLPSLSPPHPDGWIRRILLAGFGFEGENERLLFTDLAKNMNGAEIEDNKNAVGKLLRVNREDSDKFFNQFCGDSNRVWRSVTPIICSGFIRRGRQPEQLIYRALDQIGIKSEAIESVAVFRSPIVSKTLHSRDYKIEAFSYLNETPRYHAEIIFKHPVRGVLVVGKGRHAGFGLMMPIDKNYVAP